MKQISSYVVLTIAILFLLVVLGNFVSAKVSNSKLIDLVGEDEMEYYYL